MNGLKAVLYRELKIYARRWPKHAASYAMSPFLFLLVFGWGVGRHVEIEGMTYLAFMLPGLATMSSMTQSYGMATEINIARFYWRVFEEFQMAPAPAWQIALGEALYGTMRGLIAAVVVYLMGTAFGVSPHMTVAAAALYALHAFTFASAAVVAAMVVRSHADQGHINTFFIVPMSFLCGTFFPLDRLPHWAKTIAMALPLTHSNIAIRAALAGADAPAASLAAMFVFAAAFFGLAVWCVGRATS